MSELAVESFPQPYVTFKQCNESIYHVPGKERSSLFFHWKVQHYIEYKPDYFGAKLFNSFIPVIIEGRWNCMSVLYLVVSNIRSPVQQLFWVFINLSPRNTSIKIVAWTQHREHHQHVKLRQHNTGQLYIITFEMSTRIFRVIPRVPVKQTNYFTFNLASVYWLNYVCNNKYIYHSSSWKMSMCGAFKYLKRIKSCTILVSLLLQNQNLNILLKLSLSKNTIVTY